MSSELSQSVSSLFETLYRRHRLTGKSPQTVSNYRINIRHFDRFLATIPAVPIPADARQRDPGPALLSDLNDDLVLDAMQWLIEQGRSVVTANKLRIHLVSLWNFFAKKGLVGTWPDVRPLDAPQRLPRAWTREQLRLIFRELARELGAIGGLPASEWLICQHLFMWYSAERLNAQLMLRIEDLDLSTRWVFVRAESRKGRTRDRIYRMSPQAILRLQSFIALAPSRELLFPLGVKRDMLWKRYKKILKRAGLPHGRDSMFHRMRKSAISHFKAAGGDSAWFADHSDPSTTRESYEDPTIVGGIQACDLLFDPFPDGASDDPPRAA